MTSNLPRVPSRRRARSALGCWWLRLAAVAAVAGAAVATASDSSGREAQAPLLELLSEGAARGIYSGAVLWVAAEDQEPSVFTAGKAVRHEAASVAVAADTVFDIASITKLFTAVAVLQLVEQGNVELDSNVALYLEEFREGTRNQVTIRQLLTHRSGLPAWAPWYHQAGEGPQAVLAAALKAPLVQAPGAGRLYSDLGYIALGAVVERVSGLRLDAYVESRIAAPLGMSDTRFNPPAEWRERVAATEWQPWTGRDLVWGSVHDENAWALGGVGGHAGLFSTAYDLARFARAILGGGELGGVRILEPESVAKMLLRSEPLGWSRHPSAVGPFAPRGGFGHTGFTGTSILLDVESGLVAILLSNRVHPSRDGPAMTPWRSELKTLLLSLVEPEVASP